MFQQSQMAAMTISAESNGNSVLQQPAAIYPERQQEACVVNGLHLCSSCLILSTIQEAEATMQSASCSSAEVTIHTHLYNDGYVYRSNLIAVSCPGALWLWDYGGRGLNC